MRTPLTTAKKSVRTLVDRAVMPYVDAVVARVGQTGPGSTDDVVRGPVDLQSAHAIAPNGAGDFFHGANHELRTIEFERVPKGARRVLSVGAKPIDLRCDV